MSEGQMDDSQNKQMWTDFTKLITWGTIGCLAIVALMAAFLTP
ncbi:MAG: aa3-type cytochrome c oxidase subunit IV [Alphaproteobacteria bacterium]|jgi:hypothetical protein|nr:aa3-type cytochrome c oxidase subunit IV [Alphaproteobacteria bacterium]MBT4084458.1 aa3-type cytochrome c oxidase subunit IV [Alphaproteobacteria bacterium]MBT4545735.1 aa3-type cytochrome c oxidase subunit IV [Alphaproteobacteria bacterium]MBT5918209.1 aa3-type cytochrome c oxidase subunit IV [Alphaproteobacteria bacterium]MBT7744338.1 aa3-type cytochrome c oxidase subunit IV [Alphaproteobacteria bacterium]